MKLKEVSAMQKVDFFKLEDCVVQLKNLLNVAQTITSAGIRASLQNNKEETLKQVANLDTIPELIREKAEELECLCLTYFRST